MKFCGYIVEIAGKKVDDLMDHVVSVHVYGSLGRGIKTTSSKISTRNLEYFYISTEQQSQNKQHSGRLS